MRVTGGELRGVTLKSPRSLSTRPMTDRLRLALFSIIAPMEQPRGRVLDLYAGTGALGIEALSRGAEFVDFVDQNSSACAVIRANLEQTKLVNRAKVHKRSVKSFLASYEGEPFDLIFMDPPYADADIEEVLSFISRKGVLSADGLLVLGHTSRRNFAERIGALELLIKRCHGDSCLSIYKVAERDHSTD